MKYTIKIYRDSTAAGPAEFVALHLHYPNGPGDADGAYMARHFLAESIRTVQITSPGRFVVVIQLNDQVCWVEFFLVQSGGLFIA